MERQALGLNGTLTTKEEYTKCLEDGYFGIGEENYTSPLVKTFGTCNRLNQLPRKKQRDTVSARYSMLDSNVGMSQSRPGPVLPTTWATYRRSQWSGR